MKNLKIDKEKNYVIIVTAPREKGDQYSTIMAGMIRAIDFIEWKSQSDGEEARHCFTFVHNGVTSGALGHVIETINKIQPLLAPRGRYVKALRLDMDIQGDGRNAEKRWFDRAMQLDPDLVLSIDDGRTAVVKYSIEQSKNKVPNTVIKISPSANVKNKYF